MLPPFVVKVASAVLEILVLARTVMSVFAVVDCKLLFKLICPQSKVIGPAAVIELPRVMSPVLVVLPTRTLEGPP